MKVLVIGSGGREHAICAKFSQSEKVDKVYVAPGNPGMRDVAEPVNIGVSDFDKLIAFVKENKVDLTFVGPEIPLCAGIVDAFEKEGLKIFGPTAAAARLEGSKVFAKDMMHKYGIPTAVYASFDNYPEAKAYLESVPYRVVIKADGLAGGKGVLIPESRQEALKDLEDMMCNGLFKEAGNQVVIEQFLEGEEYSLLSFVNGTTVVPMQIAQDHKRAYDNDEGLNTGGMGAYTPVSHLPQEAIDEAVNMIVRPMAKAMVEEGCPFTGILYAGCMWTAEGARTIEFNVRFGDPETEVVLPALQNDLYEVIEEVLNDHEIELKWSDKAYCGVVLANKGYPESYVKGAVISGLDEVEGTVFHMGTGVNDNGEVTATGGRVLFVVGEGKDLKEAQTNVYTQVAKIECETLFYRHDIGNKGL
ncbi:MAG: phosphoribosylamine--glycine ligase [Erysipelotrichaceae bacterium]|nr:phosphoribosylamine--glycine ligase [Erysipelotrichaceae bacterium]